MRFESTQKFLTFALALVAATPLVISDEIGRMFSVAFGLLWAVGWFVPPRLMRSPRYRYAITAAAVGLMGVQLTRLALGAPMAMLGMEFIGAVMGMRLMSRGFASDYYQIVILSFLHIIAATVAIDDLVYGVCFVLFVGLSSPVLALSYLRQEMEARFSHTGEEGNAEILARLFQSKRIVSSGFIASTSLLSIPILFLTGILFVIFPRFGLGLFGRLENTQTEVGFGNTVSLGDFDIVRMEDTVLLRLEPEGKTPEIPERLDTRIRGAVFDRFENNAWSRTPFAGWHRIATYQQRYVLDAEALKVRPRSFRVLLEPMNPKLVFLPEGTGIVHTELVADRGYFAPRRLEFNFLGEIQYHDEAEVGIRYQVDLTGSPPYGEPPNDRLTYLQLPKDSDRLRSLAQQLAPGETPRLVVQQLLAALKTRYGYSLTLSQDERNVAEGTPLDRFLFSRKTGTCEHFATAFTLLLRARGVPARLVTGFSGADWNPIGRFYSVRKRTAHSWTEAFLDGQWVTLDATPGTNESGASANASMVSMLVDTLRMRWHKHVVGYDLTTQGELAFATWRYFRGMRSSRGAMSLPRLSKALPLALLLIAAAGYGAYRLRRRSFKATGQARSSARRRVAQREATRLLSAMEKRLGRLGYARPASRTPMEHAAAIRRDAPALADPVLEVVERYNEVRFGTRSFKEGELDLLMSRIRDLSRADAR